MSRAVADVTPTLGTLSANEREDLPLVTTTPLGDVRYASEAEVTRVVASTLQARTNLQVVPWERYRHSRCVEKDGRRREDLWCYVETIQSHDPRGARTPGLLLIVSAIPQKDGSEQVVPVLVDTHRAFTYLRQVDRSERDWEELVEDQIAEHAVLSSPEPGFIRDRADLVHYMDRLMNVVLRPQLDEAGHWEPFGSLIVDGTYAGIDVSIDGRRIGEVTGITTRIVGLRTGPRILTLTLTGTGEELYRATVDVRRGGESIIHAEIVRQPREFARTARRVTFWTGVATAAVGAGIIAYAFASASNHPYQVVCIQNGAPSDACGSSEFQRFGTPKDPSDDPNGGGPMIAPLGYSLMGLGGVWSLGAFFFGDEDTFPWFELGTGVAVFTAGYVASELLSGDSGVSLPSR